MTPEKPARRCDDDQPFLLRYWPIIVAVIGIVLGAGSWIARANSIDTRLCTTEKQVDINTTRLTKLETRYDENITEIRAFMVKIDKKIDRR